MSELNDVIVMLLSLCAAVGYAGSKYCPMLVKESGVVILKELLATCWWNLYDDDVPQLARRIISRCEHFAVDNDYITDDERDSDAMDE